MNLNNNSYKNKYSKYKSKYIKLKEELEGGKRSGSQQLRIEKEQKIAFNDVKTRKNFIKNNILSTKDIYYLNKRMADMVKKIYRDNIDIPLRDFCLNNIALAFDTDISQEINELFNKITADQILGDLRLGDYLLLGMLTETRFISAIERDNRPAITKDNKNLSGKLADDSRINGKMNAIEYLKILNGLKQGKYTDITDYNKYINIKNSIEKTEWLNEVFKHPVKLNEFKEKLFNDHELKEEIWRNYCIPLEQRKIQVLIYDMINIIAYNKALKSIFQFDDIIFKVREQFNINYNSFVKNRNSKINNLIKEFIGNNTYDPSSESINVINIVLGQEVLPGYYENIENVIEDADQKKVKKGEKSVIISNNEITQILFPIDKQADLTSGSINNILLVSVHTPSDGRSTSKILNEINDYFMSSPYQHIIIGIDANTKQGNKTVTGLFVLQDVVNTVNKLGLQLAYFKNPINITNIENGKPDQTNNIKSYGMTSGAIRTLLQSQYYKAMEKEESYVDFIMYKSKGGGAKMVLKHNSVHQIIEILNNKLGNSGDLNKLLNDKNPSDHKPRSATFIVDSVEYNILSHNMAGPNGSMLEYAPVK